MNYKNIFIIGAGPAGLACSYYLSKENYKVKTYEQNKVVEDLLEVGIGKDLILILGLIYFISSKRN